MFLFPETERTYLGPADYGEGHYTYMNRSGREEFAAVRAALETWFAAYPTDHKGELRSRFASGSDTQFLSSAFELYVHELLLRLGYSVEIHPDIPGGTGRHPDFLTSRSGEDPFYVEAVLATNKTPEERGADARMNSVYDAINRLDSPDYFLGMEIAGEPTTPPSGKRLRKALATWLASLDYDATKRLVDEGHADELPTLDYRHEEWSIKFEAIPKNTRGRPGIRPIGIQSFGMRIVDSWTSIRDSIASKGSRYGDLQRPFLVAVNVVCEHASRIDIMQALFGQEQFHFTRGEEEPEMIRAPNGVWMSAGGPRYTRISAILLANRFYPQSAASCDLRVYHNPWAQRPIAGAICRLPQGVLRGSEMKWVDGDDPARLLGLPMEWPHK